MSSKDGELELDKQTLVSSNYVDKVIELLPNKKSFKDKLDRSSPIPMYRILNRCIKRYIHV